jgi:hypothetical protein
MATGTQSDILSRVRALLPSDWIPAGTQPVADSILSGPAVALASIYSLLAYVKAQMRLATTAGAFVDLFAYDFFGAALLRRTTEADSAFQARVKANLLAPKATRSAMVQALTNLTGRAPKIFEPFVPKDTGGYGDAPVLAYGAAGGYGCYGLIAQAFVTAYRPIVIGNPNVAGYGTSAGGYGAGSIEYIDTAEEAGTVQDAEIYDTINATKAAGVTVWVNITD